MRYIGFSFILFLQVCRLSAQEVIFFNNQSFEGTPKDATMPTGWDSCKPGTTPDILPGFWHVFKAAFDGETYVGLITRKDGSFESIGQELSSATKEGECYTFSAMLSRSATYENFNIPIRLKIWGGEKPCERKELLDETKMVQHTDWREYKFSFSTEFPVRYIIFEVSGAKGSIIHYRGNLLLDNLSEIKKCPRA